MGMPQEGRVQETEIPNRPRDRPQFDQVHTKEGPPASHNVLDFLRVTVVEF